MMKMEKKEKISLTLNPESSVSTNSFEEMPVLKSMAGAMPKSMSEFSAGAIDESMLSDEEKEIVEKFAREIDINDVNQVIKYGMAAQTNISNFSSGILRKVKSHDLGEIGVSLKELTIAIDATTEPEKKGLFGVFQKAKRGIGSIRANYAKAETNVNRIEKDLQNHQNVLTKDIAMFQEMYELNVQYYKELTMYIIAGKKALLLAREGKLQELKEKAELSKKQEDVQVYRDFEDMCHRFEKKISDLEITRVISIQSAPQVRMLQNNDRELLDKLQSSLSNTIPLWRNQLVISLGIEHTKRALEAQNIISEKTNELLAQNAEMLKTATIETAKEAERPLVEMETLRQCNKNLITSINEVLKIHEQGAEKRAKAQEELVKIEEELKQVLLTAGDSGY